MPRGRAPASSSGRAAPARPTWAASEYSPRSRSRDEREPGRSPRVGANAPARPATRRSFRGARRTPFRGSSAGKRAAGSDAAAGLRRKRPNRGARHGVSYAVATGGALVSRRKFARADRGRFPRGEARTRPARDRPPRSAMNREPGTRRPERSHRRQIVPHAVDRDTVVARSHDDDDGHRRRSVVLPRRREAFEEPAVDRHLPTLGVVEETRADRRRKLSGPSLSEPDRRRDQQRGRTNSPPTRSSATSAPRELPTTTAGP